MRSQVSRVPLTVLDGTNAAVSGYDTNGELSTVSYANGSSLAVIGTDPSGVVTSLDQAPLTTPTISPRPHRQPAQPAPRPTPD